MTVHQYTRASVYMYIYILYIYVYHPMPLDSGNSRFFKFSINGLMTIPQYGYVVQFLTQAHEQCSKPPLVDDCKGLHGITLLVYIGDDKNPIVGIPINRPCNGMTGILNTYMYRPRFFLSTSLGAPRAMSQKPRLCQCFSNCWSSTS